MHCCFENQRAGETLLDKGHELSEHGPHGALRGSWLVKGTECFYRKYLMYSSIELKKKRIIRPLKRGL